MKLPTSLPRRTVLLYLAAIACLLISLFVVRWQISSISERDRIRSNGQKVTATAMNRKEVEFSAPQGRFRVRPLVSPQKGTLKKYDAVVIFYDKQNPKRVVLDQDDSPYTVTIWIVVAKLVGAAMVLFGFGYWTSRKGVKKKTP